jgi:hypothetical protein
VFTSSCRNTTYNSKSYMHIHTCGIINDLYGKVS